MQPAVRFEHVSKRFMMSAERPHTVLETLIRLSKGKRVRRQEQELWAVNDVSFELMPGECLGIVGRNGSGKSTILKLIARVLRPTHGRVMVRGRISALLELGAGFHADLTGRENIYLNGSVLGLSKAEIDDQYDSIVEFSELEDFIEVPVKHYSSGMYVRLGFSVAIHVKPDILILDEILAVGDQVFQSKCLEKIYSLKRQGTTIILVSHGLDAIRELCTKLLWIEHGKLRAAGPSHIIASQYVAASYKEQRKETHEDETETFQRWGSREIELTKVRFLNAAGEEADSFLTNSPMTIEMSYKAHEPVDDPEFGLAIYRQDGVHVNGPNNRLAGVYTGTVQGSGRVCYHVDNLPLLPGRYFVTAAIHDSQIPHAYDNHERAYSFRVVPGGTKEKYGVVEIPARWEWLENDKENSKDVQISYAER